MKTVISALAIATVLSSPVAARNFLSGSDEGPTRELLFEDAQFCGEVGESPCPDTGCGGDFVEGVDGLCQFRGADTSVLSSVTAGGRSMLSRLSSTGRAILQTVVAVTSTSTGGTDATGTITVNGVEIPFGPSTPASPPAPAPAPSGMYGGMPMMGGYGGMPIMDPPPMTMPPPPPPPPMTQPSPPASGPACSGSCARNFRQCAGNDIDGIKACCSPDYQCVQRNEFYSQCRLNGVPGLVNWSGDILTCR